MTWFNVDDGFYDHPKSFDASDAAVALWTRAGSWCARNLTDGFVPAGMLPRLSLNADNASKELCDRGLWKRARGGFQYHDWPDYNRTADEVKTVRKSNAERQKRWRETRRNGVSNGVTDTSTNGVTNVAQAKPSQALKEKEQKTPPQPSVGSPPRKRGTRIPDDFVVTPDMVAWCRERVPAVDGRSETEKFINYWQAKAGKDATKLDWPATWRNWMLSAAERGARAAPANGHRPSTTDARVAQAQSLKARFAQPGEPFALPGGSP